MATNITQFAENGLRCVQIGARNSNGYFSGFGNIAAADAGTGSGMRDVLGGVDAASPLPATTTVYNRSKNGYAHGFLYDGQPNEFGLQHEATDLDLESYFDNSTLYTLGNWTMHGRGPSNPTYQDSVVLLCRDAQSDESDNPDVTGFMNMLILSSVFRTNPANAAFQAAGSLSYIGTADRVSKLPWGVTTLTATGKASLMTFVWWSEYPCTMEAFVGDGVITAVPLTHTPVSAAATKFFNPATPAALTVSSVSVGSKTATLSAAPADELLVVGVYETTDL